MLIADTNLTRTVLKELYYPITQYLAPGPHVALSLVLLHLIVFFTTHRCKHARETTSRFDMAGAQNKLRKTKITFTESLIETHVTTANWTQLARLYRYLLVYFEANTGYLNKVRVARPTTSIMNTVEIKSERTWWQIKRHRSWCSRAFPNKRSHTWFNHA